MNILLTGANGYIGMRLLPKLIEAGHQVTCLVRDRHRLSVDAETLDRIRIVEKDLLNGEDEITLGKFDAAYYLVHSMASSTTDFEEKERRSAENFIRLLSGTGVRQVIYLSGIVNEDRLSRHLASRKRVEDILHTGPFALTVIRSGIIVGSGSASFEIIRDLCEKLPVMVTPKWVLTRTQPIAIRDVISFLTGVLLQPDTYGESFDIGGPDVLTYRQMLESYARVRGFKIWMITLPFLTPKLSSYWLYFVTSTSYALATNLVDSMKTEVVARDNRLAKLLNIHPLTYEEAIALAFQKIEQNSVISSWKDSLISGGVDPNLEKFIQVPRFGVFTDQRVRKISNPAATLDRLWRIGGDQGWYYGNGLWKVRGFLDKLSGGPGLRRGRTHPDKIFTGDALDFWRVLLADKSGGRLLLFAEMKLPGEAWLEFELKADSLVQTATFRPKGLRGRLYWFAVSPFHHFIFSGLVDRLAGIK